MRPVFFLAALSFTGCVWTEFDDLADKTWVRSTDEPGIGSTNYALAIVGATSGTSGGQLGVISDDTPDYSTIEYAANGTDTVGNTDIKLGQQRIAALTDPPLFVADATGRIAIAERSTTGGNISVVTGPANAPTGIEFPAAATPDAVAFVGADVVVAAGNTFYTLQPTTQVPCASMDASLAVAAMASDAMTLWVWTKAGAFFGIPTTSLTPCGGGMLPAPGSTFMTAGLMPAPGARVHVVGNHAILTAHPPNSRMGQVFVVDLTTLASTDMLTVEGLQSSAIGTLGTATSHLIVGVPDRPVEGVVAGEVDVLALDATTGMLNKTPVLSLHDAQPESGQLFGRAVTTMKFNDKEILVVAGNSEVFAYFKTALYDALP
jgi:hypothetical protein